jgi:hypothetical protein
MNCRKRNALIREERSAAKEYAKLGFPQIAEDERKHAKLLSKKNCER